MRITISLPEKLVAEIDERRNGIPRSSYIAMLLEKVELPRIVEE